MLKKKMIMIILSLLVISNVYSQVVETTQFLFLGDNVTRDGFSEVDRGLQYLSSEGFARTERLPNSVQNEINRQLRDYHPLNNGQVFFWAGYITTNSGTSAQGYRVLLRITNSRNYQWEFYAYLKYLW